MRVSAFFPYPAPYIVVLIPLALLLLLLLLFSSPDVSENQVFGGRFLDLEDRMRQLSFMDHEKRKSYMELHDRLQSLSHTVGRYNLSLAQLLTFGNTTHNRELLSNLSLLLNPPKDEFLNQSLFTPLLPNIYNFLPHLLHLNASQSPKLTPLHSVVADLKRRASVDLVISVPTIRREKSSYLSATLRSLIENLGPSEYGRVLIVVVLGVSKSDNSTEQWISRTTEQLRQEFRQHVRAGLLEIIVPPPHYYPPDMERLPPTFGDSQQRMLWRTKQNLDYAYAMMYCAPRGTYYMQLEDDVVTKAGYAYRVLEFVSKHNAESPKWFMLEFSTLGFIGKLFRSSDLPLVVNFLLIFYKDKPVDWLLAHIFYVRYCSPEKTQKLCAKEYGQFRVLHKPSLFQHVGLHSSLAGKTQKLKERDFGKPSLHRPHLDNPTAQITTSLKTYQKYTLERAYAGETFFWGLLPQVGDWIRLDFDPPIRLGGVVFQTGNVEHLDDTLQNATVEAIFSQNIPATQAAETFTEIAAFSETGRAEIELNSTSATSALRVLVHRESENWIIISEIHVWKTL